MILLVDNYDSFTYNLVDYLGRIGVECHVIQNDDSNLLQIDVSNYKKVLLSPGPGTPESSGQLMDFIQLNYTKAPILGVCLGHQALGQFFGMNLVKAESPMHGKVSTISHNETGIYAGVPNPLEVCRYHSLVLEGEVEEIQVTAQTNQNEIMSFTHCTLPIEGVQFHPEAILTQEGLKLLENWLRK